MASLHDVLPAVIRPPAPRRLPSVETDEADQLVQQAIMAARRGRSAVALTLLDQALAKDPHHLEALLWRGGLSELNDSLSYLERAASLAPRDERVRTGLAWARQRLGIDASSPLAALQPDAEVASAVPEPDSVATPCAPQEQSEPEPAAPAALAELPARQAARTLPAVPRLARRLAYSAIIFILLLAVLSAASATLLGDAEARAEAPGAPARLGSGLLTLVGLNTATPTSTATATATATATPTRTATPTLTPTPGPSPLDLAWAAEDWPQVISLVEAMAAMQTLPDSALIEKLFAAHYNNAMRLAKTDDLAEALAALDKALGVLPGDNRAVAARKQLQTYAEGVVSLAEGDFNTAVTALRKLYDADKGYLNVKAHLYKAYIGQAAALEKSGKKTDAYNAYSKAAQIDAQGSEAKDGVTRLKPAVPTPAGGAAGKKIEVDIAKQRVTAWEDGRVVYQFVASTGKAPYLTRKGEFKILSKMPNAYSSAMQWGMPWWMGIYYAGKWENGFHAMARLGAKQVPMSERVLGTPQTHGCIMLSDKNAKTLYDWAEIGTAVWIH